MQIILLFGTDWAAHLIEPVLSSGIKVGGIVFLINQGIYKYIPLRIIRKYLFRFSLFLKVNFRSNYLYRQVHRFKIPIVITESVNSRSFIRWLNKRSIDLILVAGWSEILKKEILAIPGKGCINCHPSLLPKYRGNNPFYWIIKNREQETGITFHFINQRINAGDIILQRKMPIELNDNEQSLILKCASLASSAVLEVLQYLKTGSLNLQPQKDEEASYYPVAILKSSQAFYIRELSQIEGNLWDTLIRQSLQYNFFSSSFWLNTVSEATGNRYKMIVCYQRNQPLCGCAALIRKSLEGSLFTSAPLSQYSTILHFPVSNEAAFSSGMSQVYKQLKSLLAISNYIKSRFDWAILYLHPNFEDSAVFKQGGWGLDSRYTYYLDLRNAEKLYANFDSPLKRQIKKGQRGNFKIKEGMERPELFYRFWQETMQKQKINPPLTLKGFSYIYQQLKRNNLLKTFCAYHGNTLAAAVIFLVDKEMSYYWASTLNKEYAASGINQVLLWEGLNFLSRGGVKDFDFVGADIPSIASYKKSYGGRLARHSRIMYSSSLRAKAVRGAKAAYKSFVGKHD